MKLAVVAERVEAWRGGAETSTLELSRLLAARGHDVHIITTTRTPSPPDMTIHQVPVASALGPLRTAMFIRRATAFLQENAFDIVHAVAPLPCADVYQPRGGLLRETSERNVAMRRSIARRAVKRALTALNFKKRSLLDLEREIFREGGPLVLAVSQYVADQCKRFYGVGAPRVRVVFNGVRLSEIDAAQRKADRAAIRKQYQVSDSTLLLLFVAHNFRLKGLDPLIDTAAKLESAGGCDFHVVVAGRDNPVRFQRRIESLRLQQRITFSGPTQRMSAFFNAADVCVHPTYYDPCSRVVLEALSRGVPCITTRSNGASEVIRDGEEGFVIDSPDDIETWADRITALRPAAVRQRMGEAALALRDRISMARHVAELDAVFREIATQKERCRAASS